MQYSAIPGWFAYEKLYDHVVNISPDKSKLVEVGCHYGRGLVYLGQAAKQIKYIEKELIVFGVCMLNTARLLENINECDVADSVTVLPMYSEHASAFFESKSLNFVFLDRTISYVNLRADIEHWLPRIAPGGILAGAHYKNKQVAAAVGDALNCDVNYDCPMCPECWMVCL